MSSASQKIIGQTGILYGPTPTTTPGITPVGSPAQQKPGSPLLPYSVTLPGGNIRYFSTKGEADAFITSYNAANTGQASSTSGKTVYTVTSPTGKVLTFDTKQAAQDYIASVSGSASMTATGKSTSQTVWTVTLPSGSVLTFPTQQAAQDYITANPPPAVYTVTYGGQLFKFPTQALALDFLRDVNADYLTPSITYPSMSPTAKTTYTVTAPTGQVLTFPTAELALNVLRDINAEPPTTKTTYTVTAPTGQVLNFPTQELALDVLRDIRAEPQTTKATYTVTAPTGQVLNFPTAELALNVLRDINAEPPSTKTIYSVTAPTGEVLSFPTQELALNVLRDIQAEPVSSSFTLDGLQFSSAALAQRYLETRYPHATITPTFSDLQQFTGFQISGKDISTAISAKGSPSLVTDTTTTLVPISGLDIPNVNYLPQAGILGRILTSVYLGPEWYMREGKTLLSSAQTAMSSSNFATRMTILPTFLLGEVSIAAGSLSGAIVNPSVLKFTSDPTMLIPEAIGLGVSILAGAAVFGEFEAATGIARLSELGTIGKITQVGARFGTGSVIGGISSYLQGQDPLAGALEAGSIYAASPIILAPLRGIYGSLKATVGEELFGYFKTEPELSPAIVGKAGEPVTTYVTKEPIIPTSYSEFFASIEGTEPVPYYRLGIVADVTMNPARVGTLESELLGRPAIIAHSTLSPFYPEIGSVTLQTQPEMAAGSRLAQDLLNVYFAPSPATEPIAYAYGGYIGVGEGYSSDVARIVTSGKPSIVVAQAQIEDFGPRVGESDIAYVQRINTTMSGKVGLGMENYLGWSTERQVITPAEFEGKYGTYSGTTLLTSGKLGTVVVQEPPERFATNPLVRFIFSDYSFIDVTKGSLAEIDTGIVLPRGDRGEVGPSIFVKSAFTDSLVSSAFLPSRILSSSALESILSTPVSSYSTIRSSVASTPSERVSGTSSPIVSESIESELLSISSSVSGELSSVSSAMSTTASSGISRARLILPSSAFVRSSTISAASELDSLVSSSVSERVSSEVSSATESLDSELSSISSGVSRASNISSLRSSLASSGVSSMTSSISSQISGTSGRVSTLTTGTSLDTLLSTTSTTSSIIGSPYEDLRKSKKRSKRIHYKPYVRLNQLSYNILGSFGEFGLLLAPKPLTTTLSRGKKRGRKGRYLKRGKNILSVGEIL